MSESETFSPYEWTVIESALFRYRGRIEDQMARDGRTESHLLDLIKAVDRKVTRITEESHSGRTHIQVTVVEKTEKRPDPSKNEGRWGQGGPGSDEYFSFAD